VRTHIEDAVDFGMLEHAHQMVPERAVARLRSSGMRGYWIPHEVESGAAEKLTQFALETARHNARLFQRFAASRGLARCDSPAAVKLHP